MFFINIKPFITFCELKIIVERPADLGILIRAYIEGYDFDKYKAIRHQKIIEGKYLNSIQARRFKDLKLERRLCPYCIDEFTDNDTVV